MPGKKRELKGYAGDVNDPEGLPVWTRRYLDWLRVRHYSETTLCTSEYQLKAFIEWAHDRGVLRPIEVTKPMLEAHQRWLFYYRKANGKPLGPSTQLTRLVVLKGLFKWLTRQDVIPSNPASELELPKKDRRLPRDILSERQVEKVMAQPDVTDTLGLRDRAMMEVVYSTGLRRHELARLALFDIDEERGVVTVRLGKGRKDRMVPIGERALHWVARYLEQSRPEIVVPPDTGTLFLSELGAPLSLLRISTMMREYVLEADVGKRGAVHIFRHSMATLLLEGGADIRAIQEILGHAKLETTSIYTRVSIDGLKKVHAACHPGANLTPKRAAAATSEELGDATAASTDAREKLLEALDTERAEEERAVAAERRGDSLP